MSALGQPVATYRYTDETGDLLHEVLRYAPKTFRQRHIAADGTRQWGLNGTRRRVPYALPALRSAALAKQPVVVVEGEKDADALSAAGLIATTNSGGASWQWTPEFVESFAGVPQIIIIPDADSPGRKAAQERAQLLASVCEDVRICDLAPERSDGFDVSDYLAAGNTVDELGELMQAVPRLDPSQAPAADGQETNSLGVLARIQSAATLAGTPPDEILWDVEKLLPSEDAPALVFGPPGSLKSWIAMHLCATVVSGEPFLGQFAVRKRPRSLFINLDAGPKSFRNRVRRISDDAGFDFLSLSSAEFSLDLLRQLASNYREGLIAIDCWSAIYNPDRNSDPGYAMKTFVDSLRDIFVEFQCGGLIIDHPHRPKEKGEAGDYYGNIQKEAGFRVMWAIVAEAPVPGQLRTTRISCRKLSEGDPFAVVQVAVDFQNPRIAFSAVSSENNPTTRPSAIKARLIEWADRQKTAFSMTRMGEARLGYRSVDVRAAAQELIDANIFVAAGKRSGGVTYRLALPAVDPVPEPVPDQSVPIKNRDGTGCLVDDSTLSQSAPSESVPEWDGVYETGHTVFD